MIGLPAAASLASRLVGPLMIGLAIAAIAAYVAWQKAEIAELMAENVAAIRDRDTWQRAADANEAALDALRLERDRAIAAIAADRDALAARLANLSQARKEVARAAETQDAPPAGVLLVARGQLARLRAEHAAAGGHRDEGRAGDPAGRAPDLRP